MKILVIGGSYFLGRVFVMLASERHEVTVVNRGSQPLTGMNVREVHGDRHDGTLWESFTEDVDVLVDFCAYEAGDIRTVTEHLACGVKQYVFISTVDVYAHGQSGMRTEDEPFETVRFAGEAGDYIAGKIALEEELIRECAAKGIRTTVFRPALLYGPLNYAPRETLFIRMMAREKVLPVIAGADGRFQFVYVKDGAEAILKSLMNEAAYGQAYNLCGEEIADYGMLAEVLERVAPEPVRRAEYTPGQAAENGIPLPFPVTDGESHLCSNEKSKRELGMTYTPLEEGMRRTCRAFWEIFR